MIDFKIPELIVKSFRHKLSDREKSHLDRWLNADHENGKLYKRLQRIEFDDRENFFRKLQKEKAWIRIQNEIQKPRKVFMTRWLKYAAVFILALAVSGALWWIINPQETVLAKIDIPAGYSKAILKMGDGRMIEIDNDSSIVVEEKDGTIISTDNKTLMFNSQESKGKELPPPVMEEIHIPRKGEYNTILPDGTKVWLNSETILAFPSRFVGDERVVNVKTGEAFFEVKHDPEHPFIVNSGQSKVKVLGTVFNLRSYPDELDKQITLIEGSVSLQLKDSESSIVLAPGEQALVYNNDQEMKVNQVNVQYYTAWKDGQFAFFNERLDKILKRLERWYDVEIIIEEEDVKAYRYTGKVPRYDNISVIIQLLEDVYGRIEFYYEDEKIYVRKK